MAGLAAAFGSGAMTNSIRDIAQADVFFIIGSNTTVAHPVIGYRVRKAKREGASLIVADPRCIDLAEHADAFLQLRPGTNEALINGIINVIINEGLHDQDFIKERTEGFNEMAAAVQKYTPEYVAEITNVPAEEIYKAARLYAKAKNAAILYTMGVTQHTSGTATVLAIANLAMLTGNIGKPSSGVNPLRGQNNVQGSCDMGALPPVYTAYQPVANEDNRAKFAKAWGVDLSSSPGLTVTEIMEGAITGNVKLLYIKGENPMLTDANLNHVEEALDKVEFLVVQDIFLTETAAKADVVLPAAAFAEKMGTFVNTERRVQLINQAVCPPGEAKADWQILQELAQKLGFNWQYGSTEDVFNEITTLTPSYAGISYGRLEREGGLQWPCPTPEHPGTPVLHGDKFTRGKGLFSPVEYTPSAELTDGDFPLILTTGRNLYHYHSGSMTHRSKEIEELRPEELAQINFEDACRMGIGDGDLVKLSSRRGELETRVQLTDMVPPGVVFMTFHYKDAAVNLLTNDKLDPVAKIPELKVCAVKVEKIAS